jgi:predicted ferric reductase
MSEKLAWYVARSSGIVAWALLTGSVMWGLLLASGLLRRPKRGWYLDLHRFLGGLTVVFTAVHIGGLVADNYTHFGLAEVLVPLASKWRPVPTAYGVTALYLLVAIEATSLALPRIPHRLWRWVHLSSFGLYVLATVHLLTSGADVRILRWVAVGSISVVVFVGVGRLLVKIPEPVPPERPVRRRAPAAEARAVPRNLQSLDADHVADAHQPAEDVEAVADH